MDIKTKPYKFSLQFICYAENEDKAWDQFLDEISDRNSYLNDTDGWEFEEIEDTPETRALYDDLDQ
jgi:hypothetical protein